MIRKRKQYSGEFKARVAMEGILQTKTLSEISSEYKVHSSLIMKWKKNSKKMQKKYLKEIKPSAKPQEQKDMDIRVMELDEMWHFVKKKKRNCGSELHLIDRNMNPLISFWSAEE